MDETVTVPLGEKRELTLQAPDGTPTEFILRCGPHPRGIRCPTTTSTTTSTTTTTMVPCKLCFLTVAPLCLGPCTTDADCGNQPNLYCFSVTEIQRLTGVTCPCPTGSPGGAFLDAVD